MADNNSSDNKQARKHHGTPPATLLFLGLLLIVLSIVLAATGRTYFDPEDVMAQQSRVFLEYLVYLPSILTGLLGVTLLIAAGVRWALLGFWGKGLTGSGDADQTLALLQVISDRLLISETAKRVAYRDADIQLLRDTIKQDIAKGAFDAAFVLVEELATTYGHREEAEDYREQINAAHHAEREAKITRAIARLEETTARHDFEAAQKDLARLQRLYPESQRVRNLPRNIVQAREQFKRDLERQFLEAAGNDNVDKAMELLKEMDRYLTEQEAEPYRETARGIIGKKRDNLGVQFKMAIQDSDWVRAAQVGDQIIQQFPNSRMADEVRGMLDVLREKSQAQLAAAARSV